MALKCYFMSGSPFAWRALLALQIKGLDFEQIRMQGGDEGVKSAEYLALNPHGQVPVLVDGDVTLYESGAILAYLDAAYPDVPLLGTTPAETGLIWQRILELQNHFMPVLASVLRPFFTGGIEGKEDAVKAELAKLPEQLKTAEAWLDGRDYLVGDTITAADITLYPALTLLLRVLGNSTDILDSSDVLPLSNSAPNLVAWSARIEAIAGFDEVYPPHWKEAA